MPTTQRVRFPIAATALALALYVVFVVPDARLDCTPLPGVFTVSPGALALPSFQRGVNVAGWRQGDLTSPPILSTLAALPELGLNWVSLVPTWYQMAWDAPVPEPEGRDGGSTVAEIRQAVEVAHRAGLKVTLKPHVDARDQRWRGEFAPGGASPSPAAAQAWLAAYRQRLLDLADLARDEGVEQLVIGTELVRLSTDPGLEPTWRQLIADVRAHFPGKLTYAANWGRADGEFRRIRWWDALDAVGVDAYFPLSTREQPLLADLVTGWHTYREPDSDAEDHWFNDVARVHRETGKPVLFAEIGYPSHAGAARRPWQQDEQAGSDEALQAAAYRAALAVWSRAPWLAGVYWWVLTPNGHAADPANTSYAIRGKPAMEVMASWYRAAASRACVPL